MDGIQIMTEEHVHIKKILAVFRKLSLQIINDHTVDTKSFYDCIDVVKNFADKYHHGKEEDFLFKMMSAELGSNIEKGPIAGMLAEHDLGRLYISNLVQSLENYEKGDKDSMVDIIGSAMGYTELLHRHIQKEDSAIYTFAAKKLSPSSIEKLNESVEEFENDVEKIKIKEKYMSLIQSLEKKYL